MSLKPYFEPLFLLFFSNALFSQTPPTIVIPQYDVNIVPEAYFQDDNINKFTGTWRWFSGTDTVIINLKKMVRTNNVMPYTYYEERLFGCHLYKKNGQIIESSMQNINSTNGADFKLVGGSDYKDSLKANLILGDVTRSKSLDLILKYVGGTPNQLIWHTDFREGCVNCLPGSTLPRDMILIKQ